MKLYKKQAANTLFGYSPPVFISYCVTLLFTLFCQLKMLYLSVSCHIEIIILVNASVAFCIFIGQCLLLQKTKAVFTVIRKQIVVIRSKSYQIFLRVSKNSLVVVYKLILQLSELSISFWFTSTGFVGSLTSNIVSFILLCCESP